MINHDGFCEVLKAPKCAFELQDLMFDEVLMIPTILYMTPEGKSCVSCEDSHIPLLINSEI